MKLFRTLAIAALAIAGLTFATPAQARYYRHYGHHFWGPRVGVVYGGYYGDPYYYGGGPYYYGGGPYYGSGVTFGFGGRGYGGGYYHGGHYRGGGHYSGHRGHR